MIEPDFLDSPAYSSLLDRGRRAAHTALAALTTLRAWAWRNGTSEVPETIVKRELARVGLSRPGPVLALLFSVRLAVASERGVIVDLPAELPAELAHHQERAAEVAPPTTPAAQAPAAKRTHHGSAAPLTEKERAFRAKKVANMQAWRARQKAASAASTPPAPPAAPSVDVAPPAAPPAPAASVAVAPAPSVTASVTAAQVTTPPVTAAVVTAQNGEKPRVFEDSSPVTTPVTAPVIAPCERASEENSSSLFSSFKENSFTQKEEEESESDAREQAPGPVTTAERVTALAPSQADPGERLHQVRAAWERITLTGRRAPEKFGDPDLSAIVRQIGQGREVPDFEAAFEFSTRPTATWFRQRDEADLPGDLPRSICSDKLFDKLVAQGRVPAADSPMKSVRQELPKTTAAPSPEASSPEPEEMPAVPDVVASFYPQNHFPKSMAGKMVDWAGWRWRLMGGFWRRTMRLMAPSAESPDFNDRKAG